MEYAAASMGFDLKVKYGNDSPLRVRELALKAMQEKHKPDFLIVQFNGPLMPDLLQQGQKQQVQIVTINTPAAEKDKARIGQPGPPLPTGLPISGLMTNKLVFWRQNYYLIKQKNGGQRNNYLHC